MGEEIVKEEVPRVWIFVAASALSPSQPETWSYSRSSDCPPGLFLGLRACAK